MAQPESTGTPEMERSMDGASTSEGSIDVQGAARQAIDMREALGQAIDALKSKVEQCPFLVHIAIVLSFIWVTSLLGANNCLIYVVGFIFLYQVESRHYDRIRKRIRHDEWKNATRKQLLSDFESVRWLNEFLDKAWPAFMERFASAHFLGPLMPFFLDRYKPWTVQDAVLQSFCLGRTPPTFTGMRTVEPLTSDDNLVLEGAMEFVAADDMSAVLAVQLKRRFGGIWTKVHISNLHLEGKVRIGVKFIGEWPFVSRLRISFEKVPYVQITARPVSNIGMDVAELPGIATWLDAMLLDALVDTIVMPNMLEINVEKIASLWSALPLPNPSTTESPRVATVFIEILDGMQLKPADANGLSDPFVKGLLNTNRFKTTVKRKTLNPKWMEEFRLPVRSWDEANRLILRVRDKDLFRDDNLGYCEMMLNSPEYRDGQRHEFSIPLKGVKTGRINLAITIEEADVPRNDKEEDDEKHTHVDQHEVIHQGIFSILRPGRTIPRQWIGRKGRREIDPLDIVPDSGCIEPESPDLDDEKERSRKFWRWSHKERTPKGKPVSGELLPDGVEVEPDWDDENDDKEKSRKFWRWGSRGTPKGKTHVSGELVREGMQVKVLTEPVEETSPTTISSEVKLPTTATEKLPTTAEAKLPTTATERKVPVRASEREVPVRETLGVETSEAAFDLSATDEASPKDETGSEDLGAEVGRGSMRQRAKGMVKHAEKTAVHIGHSAAHLGHNLFRKKSSRSRHDGQDESPLQSPHTPSPRRPESDPVSSENGAS